MATPDPKVTAKRADPDDEKMRLLKELAKMTKPTGPTAKGESVEKSDD